ncbi:MAG TPA: hypothetical protein VGE21_02855 [Flavobacteriales bacterium]
MLLLILLFSAERSAAQSDSTSLYRKIHEWSNKRKFTQWIYSGIFVPPRDEDEPPPKAPATRRVNPFIKYKGRVVRNIQVHTFDPFGFSVDDTTKRPVSGLQGWGNALHRRTRERIARNVLIVKPMRRLDPLEVSESERVLRTQPYINDARIEVKPVPGTRDSVDLVVLVHDRWSVVGDAEGDLSGGTVEFGERNLMGWGHSLQQELGVEIGRPQLAWNASHEVFNIGRSYMASRTYAAITPEQDMLGFSLNRPFYSPVAKWAGAISWNQTWSKVPVMFDTTAEQSTLVGLSPANFDTWLGRSFVLGDGQDMGSRSSNVIVAARYAQTRYATRPPVVLDTVGYFRNSSIFLVSTGISIRQYYKERYLYRFGASEDVPEGLLARVVTGVRRREAVANEPYVGLEAMRARNYEDFGYLSIGLGYGTFFREREGRDATLRANLLYFTDLRTWGKWHFRQFFRLNMVYGGSKLPTDFVDLNGDQLYGFESVTLRGTRKEVFSSETVFYAPYNFLGFRIAPVVLFGVATLGEESDALFSGRIHSAWNVGVLVRNENLLTSTFEITLGFYPYLPDNGSSAFLLNRFGNWSARTTDLAFPAPSAVAFN